MNVNLIKYVKDGTKWRFVPVQFHSNGRVKPDSRSGAFYIEWRENGKRKRKNVGTDPGEALAERTRHEHRLALGIQQPTIKKGPTLTEAVESFLEEKLAQRKSSTHISYRNSLVYFLESCSKPLLSAVTREDVLAFITWCRAKGHHPRTVYNHYLHLMIFLKHHGLKLMKNGDAPAFVEEEPEAFDSTGLDAFFSACTRAEWLIFQFFLCTGMREQEVIYSYISDVDLKAGVIRVSPKTKYNWTPKAYKGREIPIPERLRVPLEAYIKSRRDNSPLLFPSPRLAPQKRFRQMVKTVARRAQLNAEDYWLHKFRASFATQCLQGGVDLRTVQSWMGHTDLKSTMRYLRPARGPKVNQKVNEIFG